MDPVGVVDVIAVDSEAKGMGGGFVAPRVVPVFDYDLKGLVIGGFK